MFSERRQPELQLDRDIGAGQHFDLRAFGGEARELGANAVIPRRQRRDPYSPSLFVTVSRTAPVAVLVTVMLPPAARRRPDRRRGR